MEKNGCKDRKVLYKLLKNAYAEKPWKILETESLKSQYTTKNII